MEALLIAAAGILGLLLLMSIRVVPERTARIVQRFGKFSRVLEPGIHILTPFVESVAGKMNLKIQQLDVRIETKTKDNVFVKLHVSVQVQVMKSRVREAFYELDHPYDQISAYVLDVVRAEVPKLDLDDVFARKDDIANAVKSELAVHMEQYGYHIIQALVTDIDPDAMVKESMNRINAARRNKEALAEDAEGRKIAKIKDAEAEKESKRLQGEGVAEQRLAIIKGFADSVEDFSNTLKGVSPVEIMQFVLMTQHYDTMKDIGEKNSSILVPYTPNSLHDIQTQIMQGTMIGHKLVNPNEKKEVVELTHKSMRDRVKEEFEQNEKTVLDIEKNIDETKV